MSKDCKKKTWITVEEPGEKVKTDATPTSKNRAESLEQDDNPYYSCLGDDGEYDEDEMRALIIVCSMAAVIAVSGIVAVCYGCVRLIRKLRAKSVSRLTETV